ncbi:MAG: hypothetical protein KY476_00135 [Planctomycetes bacterium]|nr:hypothetical protein [Planctomycetota bacterium]
MARGEANGGALKQAVKEALNEAFLEQRELLRDLFAEAIEDLALGEAIREGRKTKAATRKEVFGVLEGKP